MTRVDVFALLVASLFASTTTTTASADETARAHAERHVVTVKIAGDAADVVLEALRERIDGDASFEIVPTIDPESVVTPGPSNDAQLARIWIDLRTDAETIMLYIVDGSWEHVLVRPVARQANPEVTHEEIGHIVDLALDALRAGQTIGVGRAAAREQLLKATPAPPAPPAPPPEAPPAPRPQRPRVRVGGFYATTVYGSNLELATGPGLVVELHQPTELRGHTLEWGLTSTVDYRFPSTVDRGTAVVRFEGGALHALFGASYAFTRAHELMLGVGGGVELVRATGQSVELANVRFADGEINPIATARVLARYGLRTPSFRLFGGLGLDVPFANPRYLLSRPTEPVVLFAPWAVRPFVLVGIETN